MTELIQKIIKYVFGKDLGAETIRYLVIGGLTTVLNFSLFELLYNVVGIHVTVSNVISISISILFAYVTNKLIVFRHHSGSLTGLVVEFLKFVGSRLFTMALEIGAVLLFHNILGLDARIGKISSQILVIISNYLISKLIVFRGKAAKDAEKGQEDR